jgi:nickel-dependent lactate racemase
MRVRLDYGKNGLEVELPDANLVGVLTLTPAPPLPDLQAAAAAALAKPIGARPLAEIARGRKDACIAVCDVTRPVPNPVLLPPILDALAAGGLPRERVTILIATGTHRPNTPEELDAILGPEIARTCRVVNHVCTDAESHRDLGVSPNGVPIRLDRSWCDADLKITVGLIEPHFMAGYSGGRKLVMPGLAALETVQAWHSPRFLEHPNATSGVVEGNPVHEEALAIARLAPPDSIVDVTLDERNRVTGVFAGEMEAAWRAGAAFADKRCRASLPEPADIVVTTCAGYPLDATFYQAVKGMVGALPAVKPGGSIVIAASCSEGIGGPHFRRLLAEWDDLEAFTEAIQRPGWTFVPDQWEVEELAKAARHNAITCVCDGIPRETLAQLFVTPAATMEEAVAAALRAHGPNATIAAIPKGPYVIPYVKELNHRDTETQRKHGEKP